MKGLPLDEIIVEEGVSGSVPLAERPAGSALVAKLKEGDLVFVSKLDRIFRSALDALQVVENMRKRGISLHLLDLGGDISNGLSKLFLTIAAAFAEAERDRIRERVGQVKADQKARGRYLGGAVPFGWRKNKAGDLIADAAQQEAIKAIHEGKEAGMSLRRIAEAARANGIEISHQGVKSVLARSR
jgi:DNA invertase Pin-like site-specific DNA recombinase